MVETKTKTELDPRLLKWIGVLFSEVVVLSIAGVIGLWPRWEGLLKMRRQLGQDRERVVALAGKVELLEATLPQLLSQYPFVTGESVLTGKDVGVAIGSIKQVADSAGVQLVKYAVDPGEVYAAQESEEKGDEKKKVASKAAEEILELEVTVSGDSDGIKNFLELVDASLPLKSLSGVQLRAVEGIEQLGSLFELSVKIATYYVSVSTKVNTAEVLKPVTQEELTVVSRLSGFVRPISASVGSEVETGNQELFGL